MSEAARHLDQQDRERLLRLVNERGEYTAALELDLSRQTVARLIAGLKVQRGTAELARARLRALAAGKESAAP